MRILISGASGLVGSALAPALSGAGHEVVRLVRRPPRSEEEVRWRPATGAIDGRALEGMDALVHLSGENLTSGRWTAARKESLRSSRVHSTKLLADTIAKLEHKPRVFVTASAIGIYGDRGGELLTEDSAAGHGFLADLVGDWEAASGAAEGAGVRVVRARFGLILTRSGGLLARLLLPFRLGLGGPIAGGRAWWSWVAMEDVVRAIVHSIENERLAGAVNVVAPHAVTNSTFTRALGRALSRPAFFPVPAAVLRGVFGEMADQAILASQRVEPRCLARAGFEFAHPELDGALRNILGR